MNPAIKKLLVLPIVAMLGATTVLANDAKTPRSDLVVRVESCEAIIREFMASPATAIPPQVWQRARGVMIHSQLRRASSSASRAATGSSW